jgi:hypothetical protein
MLILLPDLTNVGRHFLDVMRTLSRFGVIVGVIAILPVSVVKSADRMALPDIDFQNQIEKLLKLC